MTRMTKHVVQGYVTGKKDRLMPAAPLIVQNAHAARERAQKLFETGRYAGVDAYTVTSDPDAGEYGEPDFHARFGRVPEYGDG